MSKTKENYELLQTKISPQQAELLDAICNVLGVNTYQIFQMFFYVLCKASAPMHELTPEIRKIMTMMETDAAWSETFNMANPERMEVAQVILILQQQGKKGFGAVMIDRPFMDKVPDMVDDLDKNRADPQMTENVNDILERVCEVTMHGIYRRLRMFGARMECNNLSDILLTLVDGETIALLDEEAKAEMKGEALYDSRGRKIEYGQKSKAKQHRTPDSVAQDQRLLFDDFSREFNHAKTKEWEGEQRGDLGDDHNNRKKL
jgi:hypothetical protein